MTSTLVDNDNFIARLQSLFESSNQKGSSLWLTHTRLSYDGEDAAMKTGDNETDTREYPCLIRATDGHTQFSTRVEPRDLPKFHTAYGAVLKSSMTALRKRDKKREKERAERTALRKKRMLEPVVIEGPKRGNGRRKRQRLIKFALKQEESRKKAEQREQKKSSSSQKMS
ncbi:signal recognition particle, SRP9/SRP14 subunit [Rickenella mellea]|uniref:Signal recognition particle subunit SRP14 n=1 Tax=Rickenella mellea TaxID=50990 RepID=A0A4Y7QHT4_9AGAM|nr:signal recognition particle, SRP9/SRP14 subunit [Rickenella mellea]